MLLGMPRNRTLDWALLCLFISVITLVAIGCEQTDPPEPDKNKAPETEITIGPEERGAAFYRVHMFWKGFDDDGLIRGYEYALGDTLQRNVEWNFTTKTDSVFVYQTADDRNQDQQRDHIFYVRAIDNEGKEDRTPSFVNFRAFTTAEPRSIVFREVAFRLLAEGDYIFAAGGENGLEIFDRSDRANIRRVNTVFTGGNAISLAHRDGYVFLADAEKGVTIIDARNPESAFVTADYQTLGRSVAGVTLQDNYLFVADGKNGIVVLDVSVPEEPAFFGRYRPNPRVTFTDVAIMDGYVIGAGDSSGVHSILFNENDEIAMTPAPNGRNVGVLFQTASMRAKLQDGIAYIADGSVGLWTLGVGADGSLDSLDRLITGGLAVDVEVVGDYAYVADGPNGLVVVDVSDPMNLTQVRRVGFSGDVTGVFADGDTLYVGNDDRGFVLIDISDPASADVLARPSLRFCFEEVQVAGRVDTLRSPAEAETLIAFSDVKFCWEGISPGGRVIGYRYELGSIDNVRKEVGPDSLEVSYSDLPPKDLYIFSVDTKDETGLWSTGNLSATRRFTVNYDPQTTIDSVWYDPNRADSDELFDITGQDNVLIEDGSTIFFRWSTTDKDSVVGDTISGSFWTVNGAGVFSPDSLELSSRTRMASAGPLPQSPATGFHRLIVGGIDSFGRREAAGAEFRFQVNFPPDVTVTSPEPNQTIRRPVGDKLNVQLNAIDRDGLLEDLRVIYRLELDLGNGAVQRIADGEVIPDVQNYSFDIPLNTTRGIFVLTVTPFDRAGLGKRGPIQNVTFFIVN